jgi:hypothetical protein
MREVKVSTDEAATDGQQRVELKKTLQKFAKLCMKIVL